MSENGKLFGYGLPESWELLTIGDVMLVVGGSTPMSKESDYWGGSIPWLGVADLTDYTEKRISQGDRSITQAGFDSCATQTLPAGSVLFSSRAPIGYVAIAENPLCTSQGFKSLVLPKSVSSDFVYWWMRASKPLVEALASGTTFKEISGKGLARVPFPLPPRAEQDRIVEAIESAMAAVDEAGGELQQAETLAGQLTKKITEAAILGDQDERAPLRELLSVPLANGRSVRTADDGFPVLRLTAIRDGLVDPGEAKIGEWSAKEASQFLIQEGDFLVVRGNGSLSLVGRGGLVDAPPPPVAYPDTAIRVRVDPQRMRSDFLALAWNTDQVRQQIESQARTSAGIYKINQSILEGVWLPVPSLRQQMTVIEDLNRISTVVDRTRVTMSMLGADSAALRRSILHQAFTGQLVPQDPSDEPASELLELIKAEKANREAELKEAKKRSRKSNLGARSKDSTKSPVGAG